jgi:hypothetical protein
VTFRSGALFERSFVVPGGVLEVLAEVMVDGHRLELRDIAVYPRGAGRLEIPAETLLTCLREVAEEVRAAGFDNLRVTGTRLSGARAGRRVDVTIRLHEGRP